MRQAMERMLGEVAGLACRFRWLVLVLSLVGAAAGTWLSTTRLGVVNSVNDLIHQDSPVLKTFLNYQKEFQTTDPLVIVVKAADFDSGKKTVDALAQRLEALKPAELKSVYYRNDLSRLRPHFLLYQSVAELEAILTQLQNQKKLLQGRTGSGVNLNELLDEGLRQFDEVSAKKGKGDSLDNLDLYADRMVKDLEKLARLLARPPEEKIGEASAYVNEQEAMIREELRKNEYLVFDEGRLFLMMLNPSAGGCREFSPYEKVIGKVRAIISETQPEHPGSSIGLTGEHVLMTDELKQSEKDMSIAFGVAFVLIASSFFLFYREIFRPLLALLALLCAIAWTYGAATLTIGHLNLISQAVVLMLLGLGIDFSIQVIGRYEEERAAGRGVEEALRSVLARTGVAILTGGLTTALAFFTMCFNDFVGLAELGAIAGMGILFCLVASLILLPALIAICDTWRKAENFQHQASQARLGQKLDSLLVLSPRITLLLIALLTLGLIWQAQRIQFDYNLLNMQNPRIESVRLARELVESPALSFLSV
ncbi:MAG: MMPL family transporter [Blastochloris sp.]|nr:MMPL family transporter [Blastochloris sp.]